MARHAYRTQPPKTKQRSVPLTGMRPPEFRALAKRVYGDNWKVDMAKAFGVNRVTVWRWATGKSVISVPIAIALRSKASTN